MVVVSRLANGPDPLTGGGCLVTATAGLRTATTTYYHSGFWPGGMKKLIGTLGIPPRGIFSRISVTHEHYKKIKPAKGSAIYTQVCPDHSDQTPRLPVSTKYVNRDNERVNGGHEFVCVLCWNSVGPAPADKEAVTQVDMIKVKPGWAPFRVYSGKKPRVIRRPKGRGVETPYKLYVNSCQDGEHFIKVFHASVLSKATPTEGQQYGWPWLVKSEASVCILCWSYWDEKETGKVELPPWAEKSA